MTLSEFRDEFNFKYDAASQGGPDIDNYEMSLMLTQAVRDITELAVSTYEVSEESRRLLAGLLMYHNGVLVEINIGIKKFIEYSVSLPENLLAVLREEPKLKGCVDVPEVVISKIDEANSLLNNPFKRPNSRKVLRVENSKSLFTVFSLEQISSYKITYVKEIDPIIIEDLDEGMSIEGIDSQHNTILPDYIHHKIIDLAVAKTISVVRTNGKQQQ